MSSFQRRVESRVEEYQQEQAAAEERVMQQATRVGLEHERRPPIPMTEHQLASQKFQDAYDNRRGGHIFGEAAFFSPELNDAVQGFISLMKAHKRKATRVEVHAGSLWVPPDPTGANARSWTVRWSQRNTVLKAWVLPGQSYQAETGGMQESGPFIVTRYGAKLVSRQGELLSCSGLRNRPSKQGTLSIGYHESLKPMIPDTNPLILHSKLRDKLPPIWTTSEMVQFLEDEAVELLRQQRTSR